MSSSSTSTGSGCGEDPCKLTLPQCGCDQEHQCSIDPAGERWCAAKGTTPVGAACGMSLCEPGSMCFGNGAGARCAKFCSSTAECIAPGGRCYFTIDDAMGGTVPDARLCTENCDPTTNEGCGAAFGSGCQALLDQRGGAAFTACLTAGSGTQDAPCPGGFADCAPNFGCFNNGVADVCLPWCTVGGAPCGGALTCFPLTRPIVIGAVEYGVCN